MYPEICRIGPFTVFSYGLMLALAFIISSALASQEAKRQGFNPDTIFNLLFLSVISGVLGARIFYVAENLKYYSNNLLEMFMLQRGGLSWFGGLILGLFSSIVYLKSKRLDIYKTIDLVVPFIALAQAIGRIGCLLNGCCYGKVSQFGIYFPVADAILIPTQIYSSLLLIIIYVFLRFMQERPHRTGEILFAYLLLYSAKRFFIEFWRADNPVIFRGLTLFQIISVIIFFISLLKLIQIKRSKG